MAWGFLPLLLKWSVEIILTFQNADDQFEIIYSLQIYVALIGVVVPYLAKNLDHVG